MVIKKLVILSVAIALILGSIVFLFFYDEESHIKEKIKSLIDIKEDIPEQEATTQTIHDESGSEDLEESGEDGDSNQKPSSEESCSIEQISYSLKNFDRSFECQTYNEGNCIHLIVNCLVEIHNLDSKFTTGEFKLSYNLESDVEGVLGTNSFNEVIPYNEFRLFNADFTFTNPEGLPENLNCKIKIENIPKKEVCV